MPSFKIFIPMTADQKKEYKELQERQAQLNKDMAAFTASGVDHPDVATAKRIAAYDGQPKSEIVSGDRFVVTFSVYPAPEEKDGKPGKPVPSSTYVEPPAKSEYIDPRTMNTLLHSKLLSDDQKLKVLSAAFPKVMKEVADTETGVPEADPST